MHQYVVQHSDYFVGDGIQTPSIDGQANSLSQNNVYTADITQGTLGKQSSKLASSQSNLQVEQKQIDSANQNSLAQETKTHNNEPSILSIPSETTKGSLSSGSGGIPVAMPSADVPTAKTGSLSSGSEGIPVFLPSSEGSNTKQAAPISGVIDNKSTQPLDVASSNVNTVQSSPISIKNKVDSDRLRFLLQRLALARKHRLLMNRNTEHSGEVINYINRNSIASSSETGSIGGSPNHVRKRRSVRTRRSLRHLDRRGDVRKKRHISGFNQGGGMMVDRPLNQLGFGNLMMPNVNPHTIMGGIPVQLHGGLVGPREMPHPMHNAHHAMAHNPNNHGNYFVPPYQRKKSRSSYDKKPHNNHNTPNVNNQYMTQPQRPVMHNLGSMGNLSPQPLNNIGGVPPYLHNNQPRNTPLGGMVPNNVISSPRSGPNFNQNNQLSSISHGGFVQNSRLSNFAHNSQLSNIPKGGFVLHQPVMAPPTQNQQIPLGAQMPDINFNPAPRQQSSNTYAAKSLNHHSQPDVKKIHIHRSSTYKKTPQNNYEKQTHKSNYDKPRYISVSQQKFSRGGSIAKDTYDKPTDRHHGRYDAQHAGSLGSPTHHHARAQGKIFHCSGCYQLQCSKCNEVMLYMYH